jgi:Domain of unknown function (DUF5666)
MRAASRGYLIALLFAAFVCVAIPLSAQTKQPNAQADSPGTVARRIGSIKAINGNAITLTPDSGPDVNITVQPNARIMRTAPGAKDLNGATPIQLQDLQVGDRILVGGKIGDDGSLSASAVVAMKLSDLEAKHQQDLQDWQKRGVGGVVSGVDPAAGTVTISISNFGPKKDLVIHTSAKTVIRRYAPDSVKFDDAKPGTLAEIHPGDQVRARGSRNADGNELTAEELVSGTFRNIAGTINSADASSSTISVHDLISKKSLTVKVTPDSQLRQLPAEMAQRLAMRLKPPSGGGSGGQDSANHQAPPGQNGSAQTSAEGQGAGARRAGSGAPDLQQMLTRLPALSLNDLHKGEAVVVLTTEGSAGTGSVITLLTGVEPILQAAPNGSAASILTPWSLGSPAGDAGGP